MAKTTKVLTRGEAPMPNATVSPSEVLRKSRVIAVLGASRNPEKEAYTIPEYLKARGYEIVPINPVAEQILGEKAYPSLLDIPPELGRRIEVVDVFRPSEELPDLAKQVVEVGKRFSISPVFWAQLGIEHEEAKRILSENGIPYVMNACMRATHELGVMNHGLV